MQDDSPGGESWVSLSVWSPQVVQEPMANFLVEQTARGVELKGNWIKAYCRQGEEARYCLKQLHRYYKDLQQLYPELPTLKVLQENLQNEDWAESWKTFFKPIRIGSSIVVKPSWESYESSANQVVIEIDPERAFGTGQSPEHSSLHRNTRAHSRQCLSRRGPFESFCIGRGHWKRYFRDCCCTSGGAAGLGPGDRS